MPSLNFAEQLQKLHRQRSLVTGRPPSKQEVAGIVEGVSRGAEGRLERKAGRELTRELQTERIESAESLQAKQLAQQQTQFAAGQEERAGQFKVTSGFQERGVTEAERAGTFERGHLAERLATEKEQFATTQEFREAEAEREESRFGRSLEEQTATRLQNETQFQANLTLQTRAQVASETQFDRAESQKLNMFNLSEARSHDEFLTQMDVTTTHFSESMAFQREELRKRYGEIPASEQAKLDQQEEQFTLQLAESSRRHDETLLETQRQHGEEMAFKWEDFRTTNEQWEKSFGYSKVQDIMEAFIGQGPGANWTIQNVSAAFNKAKAELFPTVPQTVNRDDIARQIRESVIT